MAAKRKTPRAPTTSWEPLARWYDGWVGKDGSKHHRNLAIPAVLDLLAPQPGEQILDLGAGTGVLAPFVAQAGAKYTGIDISEKLLQFARQHHGNQGRFLHGDARLLSAMPELQADQFDGVVFLLSIQDMDPLTEVFESAAWALKPGGRMVLLMTHPCFRVPRQSGWGWDENRKLQFRRVDRYLTPLSVPLKPYPGQSGVSRSFHRALQDYVNVLAQNHLLVDQFREIPTYKTSTGPQARAENLANQEIPLFLGLRAKKLPDNFP
ncbi:MAG TPA: class I SAM-dependent methyltransferase [Anaerolineales bacterium]|nr:class I SAM-dependent methyltransferase [Anaerolineales bacterium]